MKFILAQILSIIGMSITVSSFQAKKQKTVIIMQLVSSVFFSANMFLLGMFTGALLNCIGIFRSIVYSNKEKFRNTNFWNTVFITLYILSYIATFAVFEKEVDFINIIKELLPIIAMTATTIGYSKTEAASIRKYALVSSPSWLIYNCFPVSIGGILCETFSLISVFIGMLRLDVKKEKKNENTIA